MKFKGGDNLDKLKIGGHELDSRLFVGTGKYSLETMRDVILASGSQVVTVALRRANPNGEENILDYIPKSCILLPNTSGARNAKEAIRIAMLAREMGCGNWIKIEVIPDSKYLMPDNEETLEAVKVLSKEGFIVLPYMNPDLLMGRKMEEAGAAAVMPLGAPIGSNRGFRTKEIVRLMINEINVPIIVDAGIGKPSQACEAMEMGAGAVLVNTALATASDPIKMGMAFKEAVSSGRMAYEAGEGRVLHEAEASSPLLGFLEEEVR